MSSSAPGGPPTPAPSPTPTPASGESHKLRDGIILAVVGALVTAIVSLIVGAATNSTLVSGRGTVLGSSDNLPTSTSTVTSEVAGPVVTQTVTRPPTTVTVTAEPAANAPRRAGDVTLPHDFFSGYSIDLDTMQADWRYDRDQYRDGVDLIADCCELGLTVGGGALRVESGATDPAAVELRDQCASATGYTNRILAPRNGELYCVKSDEGRSAVVKILDDGLDSNNAGLSIVVW